jgi:hypothetical protein
VNPEGVVDFTQTLIQTYRKKRTMPDFVLSQSRAWWPDTPSAMSHMARRLTAIVHEVAHAEDEDQRALGASRRARGGWFTSAWRTFPAVNQGTLRAGMGTGAPVLGLRPSRG